MLCDFEATHSGSSTPLPMDSGSTIVIPPPGVKMTDSMVHILYLLSSLRSWQEKLSKVPTHAFVEPPSSETQVSISVDLPSTISSSTTSNDVYVNLLSQDDAPGTIATSCSLLSSNPLIFHSDEDIMEALTTLDYPWDDMHHHAYFIPYLRT